MDDDRKYKQQGYMDSRNGSNGHRQDRPKSAGPKLSIDITGPRLPRLIQNVAAARCFNCSTMLSPDIDWKLNCPKCGVALHCCKQCTNFEPSTRFQCIKPIQVRIPIKDQSNDCELFKPRVTVARDVAPSHSSNGHAGTSSNSPVPRSPSDARTAFDNLFKK